MLEQKYKDAIKLGFVFIVDDEGVRREVISCKEAKEHGLKFYFTGKPCKHGHVMSRDRNRKCLTCRRNHSAQWANDNQERAKELMLLWKKRYPQRMERLIRIWRESHPKKVKECNKKGFKKWCINNPVRVVELNKKWRRDYPEKVREISLRRRAMKKLIIHNFTALDEKKMLKDQSHSCNICKTKFIPKKECNCCSCRRIKDKSKLNGNLCYHADHIIALADAEAYGKLVYNPEDFQLLCPPCNLKKGKKNNEEFIQEMMDSSG